MLESKLKAYFSKQSLRGMAGRFDYHALGSYELCKVTLNGPLSSTKKAQQMLSAAFCSQKLVGN